MWIHDALKGLADNVRGVSGQLVQSGSGQMTVSGTTEGTVNVAFPKSYETAPSVVVSLRSGSYNRRVHVTNETETGFTVVCAALSGSGQNTVWYSWVAVGKIGGVLTNLFRSPLERGWA